jgi:phospho-N-acetylmuramoyl-pentapeptide-transferase
MLYEILFPLKEFFFGFNLFRYITFRTLGAAFTSFLFVLILMPYFIKFMKEKQFKQTEREFGPTSHLTKQGTPTMGGALFIFITLISSILWCRFNNYYVVLVLLIMTSFAFIGFLDDYLKKIRKSHNGLSMLQKYSMQLLFSSLFILAIYLMPTFKGYFTKIYIPYTNELVITLPTYIMFIFYILVISGASNGVNLTDGIDGLASGLSGIAFIVYGIFAYLSGNIIISNYLLIPYIDKVGEVTVIAGSIVGALGGFLWYNAHPAQIFMGDTGALSLGATLGAIAILVKQELLLVVVGMVFVIETLSVALQITYFKITKGKRILKMAPLHHHFELSNWSETQVLVRFWIIGITFAMIALASLKIR